MEAVIIMITGCTEPDTIVDAYFNGCVQEYLVKPVEPKQLLSAIQKYIN